MNRYTKSSRATYLPVLSLALVLLLVSACGPVAPPQPATDVDLIEPRSEWETEAELAAAAEAEGGNLMVYSSMSIDDLEAVLSAFQSAYPFVHPEYYRASGDTVIQKALTESQANRQIADVYESQAFEIHRLMQTGLLDPFVAPESDAYPDGAKDANGFWTVDRITLVVIGYNSDLVDPEELPGSWEDLPDARWSGQIGIEAGDVELLSMMVHHWGEEDALRLWEGIAELQPGIVNGHTTLAELVSAGEFVIAPNLYAHRVEDLKAKGASIDWIRTDPVFAYAQMVAVAKDAPNPATGRLFVNWLLSEEGQRVIEEVGRTPLRPASDGEQANLIENLNMVLTEPALAEDYSYYADIWNSVLGLK